jgi:hypothetical protein
VWEPKPASAWNQSNLPKSPNFTTLASVIAHA